MARLIDRGMVIVKEGCGRYCEYHQSSDHDIQACAEFRGRVQALMDTKEIEFSAKCEEEKPEICMTDIPSNKYTAQRPFIISRRVDEEGPSSQNTPKLIISPPSTFPFKSTQRVPWNYAVNISTPGNPGM